MGNTNAKESRPLGADGFPQRRPAPASLDPLNPANQPIQPADRSGPSTRSNRVSRGDFGTLMGFTGVSSQQHGASLPDRRETKQEREARRLERDRIARVKEREKSVKEEHVDGGYLVTMGVYVGQEDFNKQVVRQLQIERRLAPFWRGVNDFSSSWAEHQIIAAARGLPVPPADQTPPEELVPRPLPPKSASNSSQNLNNLTVPMGSRTMSASSEHSASPSTSPTGGRSASPFKPRAKALAAALSLGTRSDSSSDLTPKEINLPVNPFVNGQPLEVFLYKNASECPICFLDYPPYLNHTRCCDQPICSECFVQIKRPDPHPPEHHGEDGNPIPNPNPDSDEQLVSEPAQCPYCQQPDFGVTYEPPSFRRGLSYASPPGLGSHSTAMSSASSIGSSLSPAFASSTGLATAPRRRAQSLSANAPNVITTDRVRPDWATKLAAQRNHQARRAAAATALHTAAFLMSGDESRLFTRPGRFSRRNTGRDGAGDSGDASTTLPAGMEPGPRFSSGRHIAPFPPEHQDRMENLENLWLAEAIRLSLVAEEERKRKADKEDKKNAKKREKEEKKAAKVAAKRGSHSPYPASLTSGQSSATGSNLSLPGPSSFGRKRGNSGASHLLVEATTSSAMLAAGGSAAESADKGKAPMHDPDSTPLSGAASPRPIPGSMGGTAGSSHLRQMSNASSVLSSSLPDSETGSYQNPGFLSPSDRGLSSDVTHDPSVSKEPLFNYQALADAVGVELEGPNAGRRLSAIQEGGLSRQKSAEASGEHVEDATGDASDDMIRRSTATLRQGDFLHENEQNVGANKGTHLGLPQVMITPNTPEPQEHGAEESKQLGFQGTRTVEVPERVGVGLGV